MPRCRGGGERRTGETRCFTGAMRACGHIVCTFGCRPAPTDATGLLRGRCVKRSTLTCTSGVEWGPLQHGKHRQNDE